MDTEFHPPIQDGRHFKMYAESEPVPGCSKYQQEVDLGEDSDVANELESLFGDVSDTDDPTYHLPSELFQQEKEDSDDLITLEDLLGHKENVSAKQLDIEEVQNSNHIVEQNYIQHSEVTAIVENILSDILKKALLLIQPLKRWRNHPGNL